MRIYLIPAALALMAAPALAGGVDLNDMDLSTVIQHGKDNAQLTVQRGGNLAATVQIGKDNDALTVQDGRRNRSVIMQIGDGFSQNHIQLGDNETAASLQVNTHLPAYTSSRSGSGWDSTISVYIEAN